MKQKIFARSFDQVKTLSKEYKYERGVLGEIWILYPIDEDPDLSYLETKYDEDAQYIIESARYTNDDVKEFGWEKVKEWIDQDHQRLDDYNRGYWRCHGVKAEALVYIPVQTVFTQNKTEVHFVRHYVRTPGLWGIESDSEDAYKREVAEDELYILMDMLKTMGIVGIENLELDWDASFSP